MKPLLFSSDVINLKSGWCGRKKLKSVLKWKVLSLSEPGLRSVQERNLLPVCSDWGTQTVARSDDGHLLVGCLPVAEEENKNKLKAVTPWKKWSKERPYLDSFSWTQEFLWRSTTTGNLPALLVAPFVILSGDNFWQHGPSSLDDCRKFPAWHKTQKN